MRNRARAARRYAIRAVAQAKSLQQLSRALQRLIVGHVAVRLCHKQPPFRNLPRAPEKYWAMFRRSRLKLPAPMCLLATNFQPVEIPSWGHMSGHASIVRCGRRSTVTILRETQ